MTRRREKVREGLEIEFDLLDSDLLRCYMRTGIAWNDGPTPVLVWMEFVDKDGWSEDKEPEPVVMHRTLDDERELAEGRRLIRLLRYKSYPCLADLARCRRQKGTFVIRRPPVLGHPRYVCGLDEKRMPPGLRDPDAVDHAAEDPGFLVTPDVAQAQRFPHADAVRLTVRVMEALGYDIPGDHGDYYEPVRLDVAEELHARAVRRPRRREALRAVLYDLTREP
jgi:hypothetical protein